MVKEILFKQQVLIQKFEFCKDNLKHILLLKIYLDRIEDFSALVHMYKSMESHFDDCFGPTEDFFRDDYFLASISDISDDIKRG